jgi:fibro-slime domain-containing protein
MAEYSTVRKEAKHAIKGRWIPMKYKTTKCLKGVLHPRTAAFLVLAGALPASPLQAAPPDSYELTAIIRDFMGSDEGGHPDMERNKAIDAGNVMIEVVMPTLGADGKPVWQGNGRHIKREKIDGVKVYLQCLDATGTPICYTLYDPGLGDTPYTLDLSRPSGFTTKANFDMWYRDVPGVNLSTAVTLTVIRQADGTYLYDDVDHFPDGYFPIDNELFGNSDANNDHNFHFTTEIEGTFIYDATAGQMFRFLGDDDVWVFINDQLVIDLSNTHAPAEQYVDMNRLGLTHGETYTLHLFQAERQTDGSHFAFTTNLLLEDAMYPSVSSAFD